MAFLGKLLLALRCAALVALVTVLATAAVLLNTFRRQVEITPEIIRTEVNGLRADVRESIRETNAVLDRNLTIATSGLNGTINNQVDSTRTVMERELDAMRTDLNRQLTDAILRADKQLTSTNESVARLASITTPVRGAAEKIDAALPFYTDCDAGMCLANVIYGIGKNTERTLRAVDRTMEVIASESPAVADSVEKTAAAVELRSRQSVLRNLFFNLKAK